MNRTRYLGLTNQRRAAVDGYMIDVQCDEKSLRVHAKNKAARIALTGATSGMVKGDDGAERLQFIRGAEDVEIPRADITSATFKGANMMVNGNLVVTTTDGGKYQLHFRKKQQADFEALAQELGAVKV